MEFVKNFRKKEKDRMEMLELKYTISKILKFTRWHLKKKNISELEGR